MRDKALGDSRRNPKPEFFQTASPSSHPASKFIKCIYLSLCVSVCPRPIFSKAHNDAHGQTHAQRTSFESICCSQIQTTILSTSLLSPSTISPIICNLERKIPFKNPTTSSSLSCLIVRSFSTIKFCRQSETI